MASCSNKPDRRHFLSIIGGDAIHLHKLEIPRQFVRFHGDGLSSVVMLKVPTGARWPVEIVRRNGQIWFHKGWREFAKYYSLVEGSSLVFEYEKIKASSQFNVIIYDKSMIEIPYNICFYNGDIISDSDDEEQVPRANVVVDEEDSDSSFQILGSKSNLDGQAQEQTVNQNFTRKKASTKAEKAKAVYIQSEEIDYPFNLQEEDNDQEPNVGEQVHQSVNDENSDMDVWSTSSEDESAMPSSSRPRKEKKRKKQENNRTQSEGKRDNGESWTAGRKVNAVNIANALYKSENPSFCIVMQPTYVGSAQVTVPTSFANKYFKKQRGFLSLKSAEGRQNWSVQYFSHETHQEKYRYTIIRIGWSKFAKENHLAVGDVCVFELLNPDATKLKFVICRENQIDAMGNRKHLKHKKMSSLEDFTSVKPYFKVKLQKSYLDHNLITVPATITAKCKNRSLKEAILQVEKEDWHVKLLYYPSEKRFKLSAGVSRFVHANSLEVGDVCIFELVDSETMLFKVSIFRNP